MSFPCAAQRAELLDDRYRLLHRVEESENCRQFGPLVMAQILRPGQPGQQSSRLRTGSRLRAMLQRIVSGRMHGSAIGAQNALVVTASRSGATSHSVPLPVVSWGVPCYSLRFAGGFALRSCTSSMAKVPVAPKSPAPITASRAALGTGILFWVRCQAKVP